ncbi:DUF602-domain-containing protein [Auriculariales sp. MPI-PUGE-AT-0066]|nr:DUF602-domain-containing protein [Auriculariales sp. MPI-PUGE-AT-0066]
MGNDGGSIPDRRDLVRSKPKAEQADKNNQLIARWFFCALSKKPLQEPIVSCALGKLYNKDALLEYLLDKSAYGDGAEICGHIRSLKDVKTLQLTPNPTGTSTPPEPGAPPRPQFVCPMSQKEMSGGVPFVYLATCGHVFSAAGLRALAPPAGQNAVCPQCQTKYMPGQPGTSDVRPINPTLDEEEAMRASIPAHVPKKRKKKDVIAEDGAQGERESEATADGEPAAKKAKPTLAPTTNSSVAIGARKALAVAEAEAKTAKSTQSAAIQSLYTSRSGPAVKETFLTKGTFTRHRSTRPFAPSP